MKTKIFSIILLFGFSCGSGIGQSIIADSNKIKNTGRISVTSEITGSRIFIDTTLVGTTPLENYNISEGIHVLRYVHPANSEWINSTLIETVFVYPTDHIEREAMFPHRWIINSEPYGAIVQQRDTILGTTPLILSSTSEKLVIKLSKENFQDAIIPLSNTSGDITIKMEPLDRFRNNKYSSLRIGRQSDIPTSVYITGGTAVVSGTVAAYLKIKSDKLYKDYRRTNSSNTLDDVRRLDLASGISLTVSEISLFLLSYILLSK